MALSYIIGVTHLLMYLKVKQSIHTVSGFRFLKTHFLLKTFSSTAVTGCLFFHVIRDILRICKVKKK